MRRMVAVALLSSGLGCLTLQACGGDDTVSPADAGGKDSAVSDASHPDVISGQDAGADASLPQDSSIAEASADAGAGTYTAYKLIGGLDRVVIFKADAVRNVCFELRLIAPGSTSGGLTLPSMWSFDSAKVTHDATACAKQYMGAAQTWPVASQSGTVAWTGYLPNTLDVSVTLVFSGQPGWAPSSELLSATNVTAQ